MGVITVLDGLAVQSIGYEKYLPIGNPAIVAENLNRFGIDEILIQSINSSKQDEGPDFELIKSFNKIKLTTPLIYSGGIQTKEQALKVVNSGIERIVLDSVLYKKNNQISLISDALGKQALIASLPIFVDKIGIKAYNYIVSKIDSFVSPGRP